MAVEPSLVVGLGGAALGYSTLVRRAGAGVVTRAAVWRFAGAIVVLAVALGPPVERAAESSLAAHMVQHQLLALAVAPLLATSGIAALVRDASRRPLRPSFDGPQARAVAAIVAATFHLAVMLAWHVPALYDAALASPLLHQFEHLTMLTTAVLAWAAVLRAGSDDRAVLGAVLALAILAVGGAVLGIVLLTAPGQLYGWYTGAGALGDQQVAGALMKVGALVAYAGGAVVLAARWFQRLETAPDAPVRASRT